MIGYTFIKSNGDKNTIEAMSLKKAIKKYSPDKEKDVLIVWTSKKGNISNKLIKLPYVSRKERKGKLWKLYTDIR